MFLSATNKDIYMMVASCYNRMQTTLLYGRGLSGRGTIGLLSHLNHHCQKFNRNTVSPTKGSWTTHVYVRTAILPVSYIPQIRSHAVAIFLAYIYVGCCVCCDEDDINHHSYYGGQACVSYSHS